MAAVTSEHNPEHELIEFDHVTGQNKAAPKRHLAIVTCMDARLDLFEAVGINLGDAHIIRNAGGIVTDDVVRSLALSQRRLGTTDVIVIQHTDCGLHNLDEKKLAAEIRADTGAEPTFKFGSFGDLEESVRRNVGLLRRSKMLSARDNIRGYVYDVEKGSLHRVSDVEAPGLSG